MEISYTGEHLWAGRAGNVFVILAFVSAILSSLSYFLSVKEAPEKDSWKRIARVSFRIHTLSVIGIFAMILTMMFAKYFEYQYVWQHTNSSMSSKYVLAAIWEGQEGSFLLWMFWHAVLGTVLMRTSKDWEAPVMSVIALVQIFLASMLLGVYVFDYKIGSSPFLLMRQMPDNIGLPWTKFPDYLTKFPAFADGRGLNPLLQNYWMTIHPPTLFLGFASTVVPFAYALAGLWQKRYTEWQKPALTWTFFGVMILGTGILMGGAWAYEALSFGGFWAWDPVENASLVPWLTFVGGAHVMLINKNKGTSLGATFFLMILSFVLVLYSTFLTRSGILGDTSVHAFTDLGMSGQLLIYLLSFAVLGAVLLIVHYKHFPKSGNEDSIWSREFWMFLGALVLLISSFQVIFTTSIPVINKIFGTRMAPPPQGKAFEHYHQWQIPFAVIILCLVAFVQYLNYKKTEKKNFLNRIAIPFAISLAIAVFTSIVFGWIPGNIFYSALLFSASFAIVGNFGYFLGALKGKFDRAGASVAHIGFGMILLGALISTSRSEKISQNAKGDVSVLDKSLDNRENVLLQKKDTVKMGEYYVTFTGREKEGINIHYNVEYLKKNADGSLVPQFTLHPFIQLNKTMGNVFEPDTRHFLSKDIYTHVTYADIDDNEKAAWSKPQSFTIGIGDTISLHNGMVVLQSVDTNVNRKLLHIEDAELAARANLLIFDFYLNRKMAAPVYYLRNRVPNAVEDSVPELGLKFAFWKIDPETKKIDLSVSEKKSMVRDFIVMKAVVFPGINILWLGCIVMITGTIMAIRRRIKKDRLSRIIPQ